LKKRLPGLIILSPQRSKTPGIDEAAILRYSFNNSLVELFPIRLNPLIDEEINRDPASELVCKADVQRVESTFWP
jgi:hypothetical protein